MISKPFNFINDYVFCLLIIRPVYYISPRHKCFITLILLFKETANGEKSS